MTRPSRRRVPACLAASANPSPNSSSRMPRRSKLSSVAVADSSSRRWSAKPTCTTTYSPTTTSGTYSRQTSLRTPPKSTSAIRRAVAVLQTDHPPGHGQTHGLSSPQPAAATSTWPSARPPSFGGTCRWHRTVKPSSRSCCRVADSSRALANTPPDRATVSRPLVPRQRSPGRAPAPPPRRGTARRPARPVRPPGRPATTARTTGAASAITGAVAQARSNRYAAEASWPAGTAPPARSPPRPRSRRRAARRRATRPRRRAGPCSRSARSPARVRSWWSSTRRSAVGAGRAPQAGPASSPRPRRAGARAPSGTAGGRRRRRRPAARRPRCAARVKPL